MENFIISSDLKYNYPEESFGKIMLDSMRKHEPNKVIMVDGVTGESITYQQLIDKSVKMAIAFKKLGIRNGDIVAIISENSVNYFVPVLSCFYIGAISNHINDTYKMNELIKILKISLPKLVICSENLIKHVNAIKDNVDCIKIVISFGEGLNGAYCFEDIIRMGEEKFDNFKPEQVDTKQQVCAVFYSSGTTGSPKGVMVTHDNMRLSLNSSAETDHLCMTADDSTIGVLPFYHMYSFIVSLGCILNGMKEVVFAKFKPHLFLKAIQEHRVTKLYLVPTMAVFMAKNPIVDNFDLSSVNDIACGGASLGPEIQQIIQNKLKVQVRQGYGLTETCGIVTLNKRNSNCDLKHGSSGSVVNNVYLKVVDIKSRKCLGANNIGEICIKSGMIMKGYLNNEQATREIFDENGFMKTGDVGYYDKDGSFFIVDRLKELIKYKGFQVSPAEIEDILVSHQSIKEAGVVGIPDEKCGELPMAFVVKQPGYEVTEEEIIKYVAEYLSVPKQLHGGVRFINELPKNNPGKLLRTRLRELITDYVSI